MLSKDPKTPMEKDEIRAAIALKRSQEEVIRTLRVKQKKMPRLQDQSDMGKLIRKEKAKTLEELLISLKETLEN